MPSPDLALIEDAANILAWRGWWEPDGEDGYVPDDLVAELAEIAQRPCPVCITDEGFCRTPDEVADHFLARRQEEWERSWPVWTCDCGHAYKVLPEMGREDFYEVADNGFHGPLCLVADDPCEHESCAEIFHVGCLPGDRVGFIRRNSKGQVKHSDVCRGCGRAFATVMAAQANPQQALF
jgi:hypothetical protein